MRMHRSVASYGRPNIHLWPDTDEEWRLLTAAATEVNHRYGRGAAFVLPGEVRIPVQAKRLLNPAIEHFQDIINAATVIP